MDKGAEGKIEYMIKHWSTVTTLPFLGGGRGMGQIRVPFGHKKRLMRTSVFFCARNRTRTCTALRPLVPETSVSTNFTIRADTSFFQRDCKDSAFFVYRKLFFEPGLKIHDAGQTCGDTDDAADVTNGSDIDP